MAGNKELAWWQIPAKPVQEKLNTALDENSKKMLETYHDTRDKHWGKNALLDIGLFASTIMPGNRTTWGRNVQRVGKTLMLSKLAADTTADISSGGYVNVFDAIEGASLGGSFLKGMYMSKNVDDMAEVLARTRANPTRNSQDIALEVAKERQLKNFKNPLVSVPYKIADKIGGKKAANVVASIINPIPKYKAVSPSDVLRLTRNKKEIRLLEEYADEISRLYNHTDVIDEFVKTGQPINSAVKGNPLFDKFVQKKAKENIGGSEISRLVDGTTDSDMTDLVLGFHERTKNVPLKSLVKPIEAVKDSVRGILNNSGYNPTSTTGKIIDATIGNPLGELLKRINGLSDSLKASSVGSDMLKGRIKTLTMEKEAAQAAGDIIKRDKIIKDIELLKKTGPNYSRNIDEITNIRSNMYPEFRRLADKNGYINNLTRVGDKLEMMNVANKPLEHSTKNIDKYKIENGKIVINK